MDSAVRQRQYQERPARKRLEVVEDPGRRRRSSLHHRKKERVAKRSHRTGQQQFVKPRARVRLLPLFSVLIAMALFVGLLTVSLIRYNKLSKASREVQDLRNEITSLQAEQDYLRMDLAPYLENSRIERLAETRLHMQYPTENNVMAAESNRELLGARKDSSKTEVTAQKNVESNKGDTSSQTLAGNGQSDTAGKQE